MKNSRRNTKDTDINTDNTEETYKNNEEKNFNLKTRYWFLEFSYKHKIHNSCDVPNSCFNYLVDPETLNDARRSFFMRWLVVAIFEFFNFWIFNCFKELWVSLLNSALNLKWIESYFCIEMYWFVVTGAVQKISTAKLPALSKTLTKSTVTMGLTLIPYHNIKQFTNLWHFWESIYECAKLVVRRCSKEKVQSYKVTKFLGKPWNCLKSKLKFWQLHCKL